MSYQALVFCPEEKTARTVSQILTELDFTVEACTEPFAAVKKLMGQHFDAIVVDCDNEQNATLLFKSARNSSSNQASLAVAVVEGQAGVAKAFRIGANLVLTKPINLEQAKGTVRVARGLLRKSDPGKPAVPAPAAQAAAPAKPAPPKLVVAAKPAAPVAPTQVSKPVIAEVPAPKAPAPAAWPAAVASSSAPIAKDADPLEIELKEPAAPESSLAIPPTVSHAEKLPEAQAPAKPVAAAGSPVTSGGAASAPAPARIPEKPAESTRSESSNVIGSTPSFSFGGATAQAESSGGSKKIILGIAAALVVGTVAYIASTQFQGHPNQAAPTQSPVSVPVSKAQPAKPAVQPATRQTPVQTGPATVASTSDITMTSAPASKSGSTLESSSKESTTHSAGNSVKESGSTTPEKTDSGPAPLVVKGGKVSAAHSKSSVADAPAPSLIGLAAPGATVPPPDMIPAASNAFKPMLQTLNVSQGVSQGLLIRKVSPTYPSNALRMGIEGRVELLATVSKEGAISRIKVLSGDAQLTRAASDAVKQWKYKPYLLNGEPVEIQTQVTINFKLPR
jgi:TonB family protein